MQRITRPLEDLSRNAWMALAVATMIPLVGGVVATDVALLVLTVLAVPAGFVLGAGLVSRQLVGSLPLELSAVALREGSGSDAVYRFRVRLGRGRTMRDARAMVTWRGSSGTHRLPLVLERAEQLVGPWTLVARDPGAVVDGGAFDVEVTATEGDQAWRASASWEHAALVEGRFAAPVEHQGKRLDFVEPWDARIDVPEVAIQL